MFKKYLRATLVMLMLLSLLVTGCGGTSKETTDASEESETVVKTEESNETSPEEVKVVKLYLGGDQKEGSEEVFAKANELLETKLPGVQIEVQLIPYGEWAEKWKLLTAAGDQMDVAWIGWMLNYDNLARTGQLMPLDGLIESRTPNLTNTIPEFVLEKATVDGQIYSVPNYQQMSEMLRGIRLYKHIADESVDVQALETKFTSDMTFDLDDWEALEPYFAYAKEQGLLQKGTSITLSWLALNGYESIATQNSPAVIRIGDETCEVLNYYKTQQFKDMIHVMADWYDKGYTREDILSIENPRADDSQPGGTITSVHETHKGQAEKDTKTLASRGGDGELLVVPTADYQYIAPYGTPTNLAIPFTAKYPEEAMEIINLLNTDAEFYNLMVYGLEGVNYEMVSEDVIKVTDPDSYGLANWATGNTLLGYEIEGGVPGWNEYIDEMHRSARKSYLMGFKVDTEPYTTELQQIDTVVKEYKKALEYGALGSQEYVVLYDEFIEKLEKAGIDTVIEGYQTQINEFLASK